MTDGDGSTSMASVLVVDDDPGLRDLLEAALRFSGFAVTVAADAREALLALANGLAPDVLVLDVMLPDTDGFELATIVRSRDTDVPILFLTARDAVEDRVHGISIGADDYVTKPFSVSEVNARLRALLRRPRTAVPAIGTPQVLGCADLTVDLERHLVRRGDQALALSPTEFRLLVFLLENAGRVVSKPQILKAVWNYEFGGDGSVVEKFISTLRAKVDGGRSPLIHTVRGFGYILRPAED
ncbi:MAG: response regulator transcription factor [Nocardioides sp.]